MKDTTTTIDEILDSVYSAGVYVTEQRLDGNPTGTITSDRLYEAKQAILKWHKDKARSYVPEKGTPTKDLDNQMLYQLQGYNEAIDQTLKAIEESK